MLTDQQRPSTGSGRPEPVEGRGPAAVDTERASALAARFRERFGATPRIYRAPGRVNLIGEHTDYNDGFVLPAAVTLSCCVAAAPRDDPRIIVESEAVGERAEWTLNEAPAAPASAVTWRNYVFGVAALMRREGYSLRGATLLAHSDVPMGAGLSSSAALEVAVATALADLSGLAIPPTDVARLCQRAEIEFVGARCGIMDQFVACHARAGHALLLDCRSLAHRLVRLPPGVRLVACNTMVRHRHAAGEYNRRRAECEDGVAMISARVPGIRPLTSSGRLRDIDAIRLEACRGELPDVIFRRCRHVITENGRVLEATRALERQDYGALGVLMAESHRSLRDDYEVSCPELDLMVELAHGLPGVFGARMTGGGFGGCTVNLVHADAVVEFRRHVSAEYEARTGHRPEIYVMESGSAAARIQ